MNKFEGFIWWILEIDEESKRRLELKDQPSEKRGRF